jgi:hypothetical protein
MARVDQQQRDAPGGVDGDHAQRLPAGSVLGHDPVHDEVQAPGERRPDRPERRVPQPLQRRPVAVWVERPQQAGGSRGQLHPLVVPQDSQTKHDPAGRIRTPQVEQ